MSFPQPQATPYAVNNYGFFRLNTPLSSPGDIYESDQSGHAFCVGPNSDIANVNMAYFDDQVPTFMQFMTISPTRSFAGLINARNEAQFSPAQRPGRILFWSDDIYDPNFRPRAFNATTDAIQFVPPLLDVIQYFTPLASVVPARINKEFVFQNYVVPSGGTLYIVVPYYGRRYAFVNFTNRNNVQNNTIGIIGVNYAITDDTSPNPFHQETTILVPTLVAPNASIRRIIRATADGMFDALVFSLTNGGPAPLRIDVADQDES
jgi:hypothetical protein